MLALEGRRVIGTQPILLTRRRALSTTPNLLTRGRAISTTPIEQIRAKMSGIVFEKKI